MFSLEWSAVLKGSMLYIGTRSEGGGGRAIGGGRARGEGRAKDGGRGGGGREIWRATS